jgi:quaternary ammonium compound-resistance protein SugE
MSSSGTKQSQLKIATVSAFGTVFARHRRASFTMTLGQKEGRPAMAWIYLTIAGLFEVGWAVGLKYTEGFTRLWPSLWTITSMTLSVLLLGLALRTLPVGTGYAVWTGIGAVGTALLGIYLFNEPATALRLGCIGLILSGIVGLKLVT